MASSSMSLGFLIRSSLTLTLTRATLTPPLVLSSPSPAPAAMFTQHRNRTTRHVTVVTRAAPTASSVAFAIALPLSLVAATVFTASRVAAKLDRDWLEELMISEAIKEAEEDDDDDDDDDEDEDGEEEEDYDGIESVDGVDVSLKERVQPQPVLPFTRPRVRNRPKREV